MNRNSTNSTEAFNSFPSHKKAVKHEKAGLATFFGIGTQEIRKSIEALDRMLDQYDAEEKGSYSPEQKRVTKLIDPAAHLLANCMRSSAVEQRLRTNSLINGIPDGDLPPPPPELLDCERQLQKSYTSLPETNQFFSKSKAPPLIPRRDPETKLSCSSIESSINTSLSSREDVNFEFVNQRIPESGYITPDHENIDTIFCQQKHVTKFPASSKLFEIVPQPTFLLKSSKTNEYPKPPVGFDDPVSNKYSTEVASNLDRVATKIIQNVKQRNYENDQQWHANTNNEHIRPPPDPQLDVFSKPINNVEFPNPPERLAPPTFPKQIKPIDSPETEQHKLPFKINLKPVAKKEAFNSLNDFKNVCIDDNKMICTSDDDLDFPPPPPPIQLNLNLELTETKNAHKSAVPPPVSKKYKNEDAIDNNVVSIMNLKICENGSKLKSKQDVCDSQSYNISPSLDISSLPGYQAIGDNCPVWKRALIEKKNKQIYEEALKEYMSQKQEEEKWKNIPEWKRNLIQEKEKNKPMPSTDIKKSCEPNEGSSNLPDWKKSLILKKKTED